VHVDEARATPFELDADTLLVPDTAGDGGVFGAAGAQVLRWRCELTDRWTIATGLNGGYIAAVLARAAILSSSHPDPLAMTTHYLERPSPGPAELAVEILRQGRSHTSLEVRLLQEDGDGGRAVVKAAATVALGRRRDPGPFDFQSPPPELPPPDQCFDFVRPDGGQSLLDRLQYRVADPGGSLVDAGGGIALVQGWIRLADGRPADAVAVPLFLDCWAPAVFGRVERALGGGVPTIEMTVHWRGPVGPGWHLARFTTGTVAGGYLEEDGELFDEEGRLVAMSRQLALFVDRPAAAAPTAAPPA
jgi:acyl-CoA thioesterase